MKKNTNAVGESPNLIQLYFRDIGAYQPLTHAEEAELIVQARHGSVQALQSLIAANLRFVVRVAREYLNRGLSLSELVSEGNLGLMEATRRFDETRGVKFITYAVWRIRQAMHRALAQAGRSTVIPANQCQDQRETAKAADRLSQQLGREPSYDEVVNHLAFTPQRAFAVQAMVQPTISLDAPALLDEGEGVAPILVDSAVDVEEEFERGELAEILHRGIAALPAREAMILRAYYGLDGEPVSTLEEIGGRLGVTRERVRQLKNRALMHLQECCGKGLMAFVPN